MNEITNPKSEDEMNAVELEHAGDKHRLGIDCEKNEMEALRLYEKSAALGNKEASEKVAAWKFGIEYRHLFIEQAEKGEARAQFELAEKYFNADDVFFWEDEEKAFYWYQKAAEQNHPESQGMLGICYIKGFGVEKNYEKGISWLMRAADNNDDRAMVNAARMLLGEENTEEDKSKAVEYLIKAEMTLNRDAAYCLAICYLKGCGVEKNIEKAIEYLKELVEWKDPIGAFKLAEIYEQGEYVEKDIEQAHYWYKAAAELGVVYYKRTFKD